MLGTIRYHNQLAGTVNRKRKVLPPVYFLFTLLIMAGLYFFVPIGLILHAPMTYLGALPIVIGFAIAIWAAASFGKVGTPIKPFEQSTHLVTGGMYRITRNPMYLGMVLILFGIAIVCGTIGPFVPVPIFIWIIQRKFIRFEEAALEEKFASEYVAYKGRVRRWL